jgi:hypothetical protein
MRRAAALREVAAHLDNEIFLALADVHETWSCGEEDYGPRPSTAGITAQR